MANISAAELRTSISGIMKGADLTTLSAKKIRNQLEKKFKVDLTSRKEEIDKMIMSFVAEDKEDSSEAENNEPSDSEGSEVSDSEEEKPASIKSKPISTPKPKPKVVAKKVKNLAPKKAVVEEKKAGSSDDDSSNETDDAVVARKLQEEEWNLRHRAAKKMPREPSRKKKKNDDGVPKVRKGTSVYSRKCILSPELAEIMETDEMARPDVVKKMWIIVKERNLLDPSNKQFAICDDQLRNLFGAKRVRMFSMMKYLKKHIKDRN